ncbi:MAG TPA: hypothetical protein VK021_08520 [Flavobacteriaceae bacterium]|nr:hypothetical protein [Flavobacteriaceae bacterium]
MNNKNSEPSEGLHPDPADLIEIEPSINIQLLKKLVGTSITSSDQFDKDMVCEVSKLAALLECHKMSDYNPLKGNIVITAFFEPSTRTRLSFESAVLRLDGKVISIPEGSKNTGVAKGESLSDIGEMMNSYADAVVVRHTESNAIYEILENLRIPLINAGNGSAEHPTQALADWFAILKWKPELKRKPKSEEEKIHLGILGSPASMRSVHSFLKLSLLFKENIKEISLISELANPLGEELEALLKNSGIPFTITNDMHKVIKDLDVIYMNSIAFLGDQYKSLDANFQLDEESDLKKDAVVLHPLARLGELDPTLDKTNHNLYFTQAHGAVFVRQALFICVLNKFHKLPKHKKDEMKMDINLEELPKQKV